MGVDCGQLQGLRADQAQAILERYMAKFSKGGTANLDDGAGLDMDTVDNAPAPAPEGETRVVMPCSCHAHAMLMPCAGLSGQERTREESTLVGWVLGGG